MTERLLAARRAVLALGTDEMSAFGEWLAGLSSEPSVDRASTRSCSGIDGCRAGWYMVREERGELSWHLVSSLEAGLRLILHTGIVAIDIPIGLLEVGDRVCDREARRALAPKRTSSVFSAPIRPVLEAGTYPEASAVRRAVEGKGMSKQSFAIIPKIVEVDDFLRSHISVTNRIYEMHPEVTFAKMNGGQHAAHPKKGAFGREERLALLQPIFGDAPERFVAERPKALVAADDVLDAFAALWTARRVASGTAHALPAGEPPRDAHGLAMAIHV